MRRLAPFAGVTAAICLTGAAWGQDSPGRPDPGDEAPAAAIISIDGTCPDARAIDQAIMALIPRGVGALPESARVSVEDMGETYRVDVASEAVARARVFRDVARDCVQRARFAAVFIVLTLLPPELALNPQPPPSPPPTPPRPPPPSPPPPASPPAPRRLRLELGFLADAAPAVAAGTSMVGLGGELRVAYRLGPVSTVLGVGIEPRIDFSIDGLNGRELRVPMDIGLRVERLTGSVELGGELSLAVAPFHAEGLQSAMAKDGTRLDVGARAGATARFARPRTRIAPFLGIHAALFLWPYEIAVTPVGGLGTTPVLWLGATAGLSLSL